MFDFYLLFFCLHHFSFVFTLFSFPLIFLIRLTSYHNYYCFILLFFSFLLSFSPSAFSSALPESEYSTFMFQLNFNISIFFYLFFKIFIFRIFYMYRSMYVSNIYRASIYYKFFYFIKLHLNILNIFISLFNFRHNKVRISLVKFYNTYISLYNIIYFSNLFTNAFLNF